MVVVQVNEAVHVQQRGHLKEPAAPCTSDVLMAIQPVVPAKCASAV